MEVLHIRVEERITEPYYQFVRSDSQQERRWKTLPSIHLQGAHRRNQWDLQLGLYVNSFSKAGFRYT
jgi:hypothetical protein